MNLAGNLDNGDIACDGYPVPVLRYLRSNTKLKIEVHVISIETQIYNKIL